MRMSRSQQETINVFLYLSAYAMANFPQALHQAYDLLSAWSAPFDLMIFPAYFYYKKYWEKYILEDLNESLRGSLND